MTSLIRLLTLLTAVPAFGASAAAATCGAEVDPATAHFSVPFELVGNWVMVDTRINGEGPYAFMVDTGATGVGRIDASVSDALGLPPAETGLNSDGVNTHRIDRVSVDDIRLGDYAIENAVLPSRDYNRGVGEEDVFLYGIVGLNFFDGGLVEFDYPNRTLTFTSAATLSAESPYAAAISARNDIPPRIGGAAFPISIDTGSTLTMHLDQSLYDQFAATPLEHAGEGRRANTVIDLYRATVLDEIEISGVRTTGVDIMVSDGADANNLGSGFLQDYVLQIDLRTAHAAICPGA